jgi:hypothetical protein
LWEAHKSICQVVNFINAHILFNGGGGFLPVPQYDQFEFIDRPLVLDRDIEALSQEWQNFDKEAHSWASWGIKDLESEMCLIKSDA